MRTNQAFYRFLHEATQQADALILAGDIFNVWCGDDVALYQDQAELWLIQALNAFKEASLHIPIYFIHGNRDFLMGQQLCQKIGVTLLPPQSLIETDAGLIYLCHGDEFCTDDKRYMALRRKLRNPRIQALFLKLPRRLRQYIAQTARRLSKSSQQRRYQDQEKEPATENISHLQARLYGDVNPLAIEHTLIEVQNRLGKLPTLMVHGHTHRPGVHSLPHLPSQRIVLPDWDLDHQPDIPRAGFLKIEKKSVSLLPFENDTMTPIILPI